NHYILLKLQALKKLLTHMHNTLSMQLSFLQLNTIFITSFLVRTYVTKFLPTILDLLKTKPNLVIQFLLACYSILNYIIFETSGIFNFNTILQTIPKDLTLLTFLVLVHAYDFNNFKTIFGHLLAS